MYYIALYADPTDDKYFKQVVYKGVEFFTNCCDTDVHYV